MGLEPPAQRDAAWRDRLRHQGVFFHRSYVGAALSLHKHMRSLITAEDLSAIYHDAIEDFNNARLMFVDWVYAWSRATADLKADLDECQHFIVHLQAAGHSSVRRLRSMSEVLLSITPVPSFPRLHEVATSLDEESD